MLGSCDRHSFFSNFEDNLLIPINGKWNQTFEMRLSEKIADRWEEGLRAHNQRSLETIIFLTSLLDCWDANGSNVESSGRLRGGAVPMANEDC